MLANSELQLWDALQHKISTAVNANELLMSPAEVAAYTGLSSNSLAVRRYSGNGPKYLKKGRFIRYRKGDIDSWLQSGDEEE